MLRYPYADMVSCLADAAGCKKQVTCRKPGHEMDDWLGAEKEILQ